MQPLKSSFNLLAVSGTLRKAFTELTLNVLICEPQITEGHIAIRTLQFYEIDNVTYIESKNWKFEAGIQKRSALFISNAKRSDIDRFV